MIKRIKISLGKKHFQIEYDSVCNSKVFSSFEAMHLEKHFLRALYSFFDDYQALQKQVISLNQKINKIKCDIPQGLHYLLEDSKEEINKCIQ